MLKYDDDMLKYLQSLSLPFPVAFFSYDTRMPCSALAAPLQAMAAGHDLIFPHLPPSDQ